MTPIINRGIKNFFVLKNKGLFLKEYFDNIFSLFKKE